MALSIIILIVGILVFVLGYMVRKYKMCSLGGWIDFKKYDKDKVADIMGLHIILLGICIIAISRINYVLINAYKNQLIIVVILLTIATKLNIYYQIYKYAKIKD